MDKIDIILMKLEKLFESTLKPKRVAIDNPNNYYDLNQIEAQFHDLDREKMTYSDASMMIIDGPLISVEAFYYYLPQLARKVLKEHGNYYMLNQLIINIDKSHLTEEQITAINELSMLLNDMEEELDKSM